MPRLCCPTCGRSFVLHRLTRDAEMRCPIYTGGGPRGVPLYAVGSVALLGILFAAVLIVPAWLAPRPVRPMLAAKKPVPAPQPRFVDELPFDRDANAIPFRQADWAAFATNFKRIQMRETDALTTELKDVPQVGMSATRSAQMKVVQNCVAADHVKGPEAVLAMHPELAHLPFIMGGDCVLEAETANDLATHSTEIRRLAPPGALFVNKDRPLFIQNHTRAAAIPALTQIFQSEIGAGRYTMVEMLSKLSNRRAAEALVQRAVFDVDASIRMDAVYALKHRPADQYRDKLLAMLDHPWDAAVQHAAEAIANLGGAVAVADLEAARDAPSRTRVTARGETQAREMVRINHINNCLLCHATSTHRTDLVRAPIPEPYTPPAPVYYLDRDNSPLVVRADVTYLRQDFAVMQPLSAEEAAAAKKELKQTYRFDYLVRTRPLREAETVEAPVDTVRAEAIAFAMKARR